MLQNRNSCVRRKSALFLLFVTFMFVYTVTILRIEWYLSQEKNRSLLNAIGGFGTKNSNFLNRNEDDDNNNKIQQISSNDIQIKERKNSFKNTLRTTHQSTCEFVNHQFYPLCKDKYEYLKAMWSYNTCFKDVHGIDGSTCSLYNYLTKIEPFCVGKNPNEYNGEENKAFAVLKTDLQGLLTLMPGELFRWMRQRATAMWDDWVHVTMEFQKHKKQKYKRKKIAAFMGSMGFQPRLMELAGKGGPLGELIQWTDVIVSLYLLGHDVQVFLNETKLQLTGDVNGCAAPASKREYDIIFTDMNGVVMINRHYGYSSAAKYRCSYRVLDSFGTMPEFNYPDYPHKVAGGRSPWGNMNLNTMQFNTLYPHTQDNTFLGFVVGSNRTNEKPEGYLMKKDKALLYAKLTSYISSKEVLKYLQVISEYFEIHATAVYDGTTPLPKYIVNHGSVSGSKIKELLTESKLFIGVGFPYEGPGPIEAMAAGTPMIQPKYDVPRNRINEPFFEAKPTLRELTSQSPYMEEFVGEPYAFTIDITDEPLLRKTLDKIKNMKSLPPRIPREFTNEGMMERLHVFTEHVDFCDIHKPRWPPIDHLKVHVANIGQSCKDICMLNGLVCERNYFDKINTKTVIERHVERNCKATKSVIHLNAPSFDSASQTCYLQAHARVYSCSHRDKNVRQICPCRDYESEQSAICKGCL